MAVRAGTAYVEIQGDWRAFNRDLSRQGQALGKNFGRMGNQLGTQLARGASVAAKAGAATAVGGFVYAVRRAADFESQLSTLNSVTDANAKTMDRFRREALKAGADTKFSALEAAKAQTELAKGGLSVAQISKGGLRSALALAAAGEMDLAEAASAVVNSMKLFGLSGKDSIKVADAFATAANVTTADVSHFAMALSQGGSAAKAAGLSFIETTAALEALADIGIRGSDAGTSLKAALAQMASPSEAAAEKAKELNIEFFDQQGNMKSLAALAGHLRDRLGRLNRQQRLDAATTLVGTDGMRALLALYDAGPQKIERYERGLARQGSAAEVAKKRQDNLKGSIEQLGGSVETLAITAGTKAIPTIRELTDDVTRFTNKITPILDRKDLSFGDKLERIFDVAKVDAQPWVDKLDAAIDSADIPERLADGVSAAVPKMAEAAAAAAPKAAGAFVTAFASSNMWGQLVIGGLLLKKMGGLAAFTALGQKAGGAFRGGFGPAASPSAPVPGKGAPPAAPGKAPGGGVPAAVGTTLGTTALLAGPMLVSDLFKDRSDLGLLNQYATAIERVSKAGDAPGMRNLAAKLRETAAANQGLTQGKHLETFAAALERAASSGGTDLSALQAAFQRMAKSAGGDLERIRRDFGAFPSQSKAVENAIARMEQGSSGSMRSLRTNVKLNTRLIKRDLGEDTAAGKEALRRNFTAAAANIRSSMEAGTISVREGTREIERLMVQALQTMGFSKEQALRVRKGQDPTSGKATGGKQNLTGKQRGGVIDIGKPTGDSVPALLERGEYVLNRNAVAKLGTQTLDRLNFGAAPRFQTGGIVALGRQLAAEGYQVGEHPAFGGVGRHAPNSYHYRGMALDVNADGKPGGEAAWLDRLYRRLKGMAGIVELLWRTKGHFDHLHVAMSGAGALPGGPGGMDAPKLARLLVDGPDSALRSIAQGALDTSRSGAQSVLDAAAASGSGGGGGAYAGWSGSWVELMGRIASERGWNLGDWKTLVNKESGGNPGARNPQSGAFGLGQFLGGTARAYAKFGALSSNPVDQIRAMAQYISDRYGNPSAALAFHNRNNWYRSGGLVDLLAAGGPVKRKGRTRKQELAWLNKQWRRVAPAFGLDASHSPLGGLFKHMSLHGANDFVGVATDPGAGAESAELLWPSWLWRGSGGQRALDDKTKLKLFIHEMAHRFQSTKHTPSAWEAEGGAEAFARIVMSRKFGGYPMSANRGDPYNAFVDRVMSERGWGWVMKTQFGQGVAKLLGGEPVVGSGRSQPTTGSAKLPVRPKSKSSRREKSAKRGWRPGRYVHKLKEVVAGQYFTAYGKVVDDLTQSYANVERVQGLTDEQATKSVKVKDASDAELAAHGLKPDEIARLRTEPDREVELLNPDGYNSRAGFVPGITQRVAELDQLVEIKNRIAERLQTQQLLAADALKAFNEGIRERVARAEAIRERAKKNIEKIRALYDRLQEMNEAERRAKGDKAKRALRKRFAPERKRIGRQIDKLRDENQSLVGTRSVDIDLRSEDNAGGMLKSAITSRQAWESERDALAPDAAGLAQKITDTVLDRDYLLKERREWLATPPPGIDVPAPAEPDAPDASGADSQLVELLRQQLQESRQRTAVSEAQFQVLRGMPPFGGSFSTGGFVPGPVGAARTIVAHGGERVLSTDELAAGGGVPQVVLKFAPGTEWLRHFVQVEVESATRQQARRASRALPGSGMGV